MIGIAPVFWLDWGLGTDEDAAPSLPQVDMLATHNAVTADPRKDQHRLDKYSTGAITPHMQPLLWNSCQRRYAHRDRPIH